jgi:hypothetical protein
VCEKMDYFYAKLYVSYDVRESEITIINCKDRIQLFRVGSKGS